MGYSRWNKCSIVGVYFRLASLMTQLIKNLPANEEDARDVDAIAGSGRSPGEGNDYSL